MNSFMLPIQIAGEKLWRDTTLKRMMILGFVGSTESKLKIPKIGIRLNTMILSKTITLWASRKNNVEILKKKLIFSQLMKKWQFTSMLQRNSKISEITIRSIRTSLSILFQLNWIEIKPLKLEKAKANLEVSSSFRMIRNLLLKQWTMKSSTSS